MRRPIKFAWLAALLLFAQAALAQPYADERHRRRAFSQAELDQMLAPIALYPDSLLSQILMATTYPRDLAEAASWSRVNSGVRGDAAVRAVEGRDWDPSVVSLVAFPEVLAMLEERRDWTERLAEAYMDQHEQVLETIQHLRRRADEAGSLRSSEELVVQREGDHYVIEPPTPEIVYVPYYDPRYVYGAWWWPGYEPIWWRPWAGYGYRPGYRGFVWGPRIVVGRHFFFGHVDWRHGHVRWSSHRPWYVRGDHWRSGHRWVRDDRRGPHRWSDADRQRWREGDRQRWREGDRNRWRDGDRDRRRDAPRTDAPRVDSGHPLQRGPTGFFAPEERRTPQTAPRAPTVRAPESGPSTLHRAAPVNPVARPERIERSASPTPVPKPERIDRPQRAEPPARIEAPARVDAPARGESPARAERAGRSSERSPETGSNGMGRGGGGERR